MNLRCTTNTMFVFFLQVFASMKETLKSEVDDPERMKQNIKDLAQIFYQHVTNFWFFRYLCSGVVFKSCCDSVNDEIN